MTTKIKLDIISDVVCPWCIVGFKHLEAAINELGLQDQVDIEWQPFELNPTMPPEGENLREHSARKYGTTPEGSIRARANITQQGAEHGFVFDYFEQMKMVNTLDSHVLLEYAKEVGKQTELKMRLFSAFFTEHKDISDRSILAQELSAVGIDAKEALSLLDNSAVAEQVRAKEAHWQQLGISGVPTVIFNQSSALTGAHPVEAYKQVLTDLIAQR
ncbi:DsbA family oxidoreductase [Shewanella saliphila]|uniref:2-hydroxychromene-2-carboxylate isomerase n=1 Tax=Shewanella saliphila TaxID=2282698 RepID=A0ABQ2QAS9_9GAMM|nr:DsbA family oxidoreductase [Shewanella saliphila]MCL1102868.1 DsbA family oxidoreductase [Shewanella saliphila]GGP63139.1 2-hydroxychromene-2-carboxylate isomerase [Shewanella saliphila]